MGDHVARVKELVGEVIEAMGYAGERQVAERAAGLYKADLGSATV